MVTPALRIENRQQHSLTPRLQQAVRLLQLSSLEFASELQHALDSNPFLEEDSELPPGVPEQPVADEPMEPSPWDSVDADAVTVSSTELETWTVRGGGGNGTGADGDLSLVELVPQGTTLRQHLHGQLNVMPLSQRDVALAGLVVESLDDDGYLRQNLDELAELAELDPPVDSGELRVALKLVQSLDPAGVAARDLRECLLLQSALITDANQRTLVQRLVEHHLERLATRDVNRLANELDVAPATLVEACERIRRFDPRPGWRFDTTRTQYVTPDVIVRRGKGNSWVTALNPEVVPKVRLNHMYADLFQRHRKNGQGELAAHLREARWTLRNVEQRFNTILDVATAIVQRQHQFFEYGPLAMKPLCLREVAREVGVHESTVCRVTNNKYMATPSGVFELKYFFSRALSTRNGDMASATAIRGVIKELIDNENATKPLSDVQIARHLVRQGFNVARRTVTKYRQSMKLPAVEQRRRPVL